MPIRFRFRAVPFLATVVLVALGIALGQWQDRRAAGKLAIQAQQEQQARSEPLHIGALPVEAAAVELRPVSVTGEFLAGYPVFLDNRPIDGKTGFYLLMPLRINGSNEHVLVARGWLPRNTAEHDKLPPFTTPAGQVTVTGIATSHIGHVMQLGEPPAIAPRAILQNLEVSAFAKASGLELQPFFLQQTRPATPDDAMERRWPAPSMGADKHKAYAFQWYALAVMAVLFFLITGFKRAKNDD
ncbi:MAG: SURF1 family protein [Gammaproteobacteria bacterium]